MDVIPYIEQEIIFTDINLILQPACRIEISEVNTFDDVDAYGFTFPTSIDSVTIALSSSPDLSFADTKQVQITYKIELNNSP